MMADSDDKVLDARMLKHVAESLAYEPGKQSLKDKIFTKVLQRIEDTPPPGTVTIKANNGSWLQFAEKIEIKILHTDQASGVTTSLWRLQPGAELPGHPHDTDEECLVLEGEFIIGEHQLCAGDYHLAKRGFTHPASRSPSGGLLMIRSRLDPAHAAIF